VLHVFGVPPQVPFVHTSAEVQALLSLQVVPLVLLGWVQTPAVQMSLVQVFVSSAHAVLSALFTTVHPPLPSQVLEVWHSEAAQVYAVPAQVPVASHASALVQGFLSSHADLAPQKQPPGAIVMLLDTVVPLTAIVRLVVPMGALQGTVSENCVSEKFTKRTAAKAPLLAATG
jgi:hypothetical protein